MAAAERMPSQEVCHSFTWDGEFTDQALERRYRVDLYRDALPRVRVVSAMTATVLLLAGLGPYFDPGHHDAAVTLLLLRGVPFLGGMALALWGARLRSAERLSWAIAGYLLLVGFYESAELIPLYEPGLEYTVPFTLLIIFVAYLLFNVLLKPLLGAALIMSAGYMVVLATQTPAELPGMIYLSLFFVLANASGAFAMIRLSSWRRRHFAALRAIRQLNHRLAHDNRAKERSNQVLADLAETDALTGVSNRRGLVRCYEGMTKDKRRDGRMALLVLDLDHFKRVNDTFGHDAGDSVLIAFARRVQGALRREDLLARMGGEEFAVLLPERDASAALAIAERIRWLVEELPVAVGESQIKITVSIGIAARASADRDKADLNMLLRLADRALYQAKAAGRNRCRLVPLEIEEAKEAEPVVEPQARALSG